MASPAPPRPAATPGRPRHARPAFLSRPGSPWSAAHARSWRPWYAELPGNPALWRRRPGMRPMHPTSPLRPETATPLPTEQQRRHQAKPGGPQRCSRKREEEEGKSPRARPQTDRQSCEPPPIDREITVAEGITVKELSEKLGVKANLVIKKLVEQEDLRHHQPDAGRQTGRRTGARIRRVHQSGQLRRGEHAGH